MRIAIRKVILQNSNRFLSRWVVILFDIMVVVLAYQSAILLRFNFDFTQVPELLFTNKIPLVITAYAFGFLLSKSYVGVIRHTSLKDAYTVFKATLIAIITIFAGQFVGLSVPSLEQYLLIPPSITVIHFLLSLFLLISSRLMVKVLFNHFSTGSFKKEQVLIFGAGTSGLITKNTLLQDTARYYSIAGFIDENPYKVGKKLEGIKVYSPNKVFTQEFLEKNDISLVIISIQTKITGVKRNAIVEKCLKLNLKVKIVPPVEKWIQGELSAKQIKSVRIEDLLEREPISIGNTNLIRELKGKTVLVTGAAGSIGSEISRQILHYKPAKVVLLDQAETPMYNLELELKKSGVILNGVLNCVIADVQNEKRLNAIFELYRPQVVFHAAAYKHVPLMEENAFEAAGVNVLGTRVMANMAAEYGVEKFVMVSTDKAVNPTNVMGATKRAAEIYVRLLGQNNNIKTQFITTRFGNVLGSNGSVIPLFRRQIEAGGPITLTHKKITRYFMTIPEACNLVLEAGAMGKGGEIFVFDMGESVKIYDLAKKMIKLSGLTLNKDIEIKEIGLRPGEKLYEELLASKEGTLATHHPKIMIAQLANQNSEEIEYAFGKLYQGIQNCDAKEIVMALKSIVPEYKSQNSEYEKLDLNPVTNEE